MRTFHIPKHLDVALAKAINHYTYQMGSKFLVNVILCAQCQPPNSMTSFARKQHPNIVIGAGYSNAIIWLVRNTYPYSAN